MYLQNRTIYVDGHVIGYQFNYRSLGSRRFKRRVIVESEESHEGVATILGREVRVRRIFGSKFLWEVF